SYHFGAFGNVWLPYKTRCKTGRDSAKSLCHEVALEFFATKATDPPHWTLNSCFGAFDTIWVHLELLGCLTKVGARWVELVLKLVPRNCVRIVRNECTQSTQLVPKPMFCCVSYQLGAFGI